ncbi:MAG: EAL domain-containing protein [Nitrospirae bacterium]|nr:EAL domain-containing protein [Candidatus Manganitrophaceae bacterium]
MMDETTLSLFVLSVSVALQVAAAIMAVRLIRVTGVQIAWILIACAILLMAVRRSITFFHIATGDFVHLPPLNIELVALFISFLMALGIALIRPLFSSIQQSKTLTEAREKNLMSMAQNASDGIWVAVDGLCVFANSSAIEIFGFEADDFMGRKTCDLMPFFVAHLSKKEEGSKKKRQLLDIHEILVCRKDGTQLPLEVLEAEVQWLGQSALMLTLRDVSERKSSQAQMKKLSGAVEQTGDSVFITNPSGRIEYLNPAFEAITGFKRSEAMGKTPNLLRSGRHDQAFYKKMWTMLKRGETFRGVLINRKKTGEIFYEEKTISPLKDEYGHTTHYISTGKDVTARTLSQERLEFLAYHDLLTHLPNRTLFLERLEQAIKRSRNAGDRLAVLFLDLDRFKNINDTLGHELGDQLLKVIAQHLVKCVRVGDTVARFGGDEFVILLEYSSSQADVSSIAKKLLDTLLNPIFIQDHELIVTGSLGISVFPKDGDNPNTLIKNADAAMYLAKDRGRNIYKFYSEEMGKRVFSRLTLETQLRRALARQEFILYYQPQIDLQEGGVSGHEALLRWDCGASELIPPSVFIPILEETGMIVSVGEWVLKTACAQNMLWWDAGVAHTPISINLSARQFHDQDLVHKIEQILDETGLPPESLELEITESSLIEDVQKAIGIVETLSQMGVKIAIDDFGTGHSALSYLKQFKIDTLKIDKSFVSDIATDPADASIVTDIIGLAHHLDLSVIAEGVETQEQAQVLRDCHCETVQGFLYAHPLSSAQVPVFLKKVSSLI